MVRQVTEAEHIAFRQVLTRALALPVEDTDRIISQSQSGVFERCELPSIGKATYNGKVLLFLMAGNPLCTEVYLWRRGMWKELELSLGR